MCGPKETGPITVCKLIELYAYYLHLLYITYIYCTCHTQILSVAALTTRAVMEMAVAPMSLSLSVL